MKKVMALFIAIVMMLSLIACGDKTLDNPVTDSRQTNPQSNTEGSESSNGATNESDTNVELNQTLTFMGYNIFYPGEEGSNSSDYGNLVGDSNYVLIVEAPSTAGIILEVTDLSDAPAVCEEYITHTLEHTMRSVFDTDSTSQKIEESAEVTYNGIEMLMTEGTFTNDRNGTTKKFSAIYLLAGENGNLPVYIVGIPMSDGYDVAGIVEAVAQNIKK